MTENQAVISPYDRRLCCLKHLLASLPLAAPSSLLYMLLEAHSLGLGAVWLGEIIKSSEQIKRLPGLEKGLDLMAVVALGHPDKKPRSVKRKPLKDLVVFRK